MIHSRMVGLSSRRRVVFRRPIEERCTMIRGMHAMFYSSQAEALRTVLKDSSASLEPTWVAAG